MSKEITAEEYLNSNKRHGWFSGDAGDGIHEDYARTYGDLRAKEAVKEFAVSILNAISDLDAQNVIILELRKQKLM